MLMVLITTNAHPFSIYVINQALITMHLIPVSHSKMIFTFRAVLFLTHGLLMMKVF